MSRCGNTATRRCLASNPERRESTFGFGYETLEIQIGRFLHANTLALTLILGPFGVYVPFPGFFDFPSSLPVFFGLDIGHCNNFFFMNLLDVIFDYNSSTGVAFRRLI